MNDIALDVNIEDIEGGDDFLAKPGRYLVQVLSFEKKWSKDGSKEYISAEYKLLDSMNESQETSLGMNVYDIFSLGESSLWKIKQFAKAVDPEVTGSSIPNPTGKYMSVTVFTDTYGGNENSRAKGYKHVEDWEGLRYSLTDGILVQTGAAVKQNGSSSQVVDI